MFILQRITNNFSSEKIHDYLESMIDFNRLDQIKRIVRIAPNFLCLYEPLQKPLLLEFNVMKIKEAMELIEEGQEEGDACAKGVGAATLALGVISIIGLLVNSSAGQVAALGNKFLENVYHNNIKDVVGNLLLAAIMISGSLHLYALFLTFQVAMKNVEGMKEYNEGKNIEAFGHFSMGGIRAYKLLQQAGLFIRVI